MHLNQRPTTHRAMAKAEANLAEYLLGSIPRVGSRGIRVSETAVLRGFSLVLRPSPPVRRHRCLLRHRCRLRKCRLRPLAATDRRRRRHPTAMNTTSDAAVAKKLHNTHSLFDIKTGTSLFSMETSAVEKVPELKQHFDAVSMGNHTVGGSGRMAGKVFPFVMYACRHPGCMRGWTLPLVSCLLCMHHNIIDTMSLKKLLPLCGPFSTTPQRL